MMPARTLLRRRGAGTRGLVVLDLGEDVSSVWSPITGSTSAPSRVAVDQHGRVAGFGSAAESVAAEEPHRLVATRLFAPGESHDRLVRSYLSWLLHESGTAVCAGAPVFLLPPGPASHGVLPRAVAEMGGEPLVFHRPLAAAVALGLPLDGPGCHFMAEPSEAHVDLAVIRAGSIVLERRVPRAEPAAIRLATNDSLRTLDPDDDLEIRERGVNLYGWAAPRLAAEILPALDLPLATAIGTGATVMAGARLLSEESLGWLRAGRPRANAPTPARRRSF